MTILSHALIGILLRTNDGFAYLINASGRQRMLSQRVASYAMQYYINDNSQAKQELQRSINELKTTHEKLSQPFKTKRTNSSWYHLEMHQLYFDAKNPVDDDIKQLNKLVTALLTVKLPKAQQLTEISRITELVNNQLLNNLNQIVYHYQTESEKRIEKLDLLQWCLLVTILFALLIEALYIFRPIFKKLSQYVKMLVKFATVDELSGLYNRRAFNDRLREYIESARRYKQICSIITIDIDQFKQVNDQHGHQAGDLAIKCVGEALINVCRNTDFCFRIGGDEFVILMPHTKPSSALQFAERCRQDIAAAEITSPEATASITVSIGIALLDENTLETALQKADQAMYKAKQAGGNQITVNQ